MVVVVVLSISVVFVVFVVGIFSVIKVCFFLVLMVKVFGLKSRSMGCVICMVFFNVILIGEEGEKIIMQVLDIEYILDFFEENGQDLFYFCCVGVCFICVGKVEFGLVD